MSTTVTYKGSVITTAENNTKVLETANTWLEDDITLIDVTSGGGGSTLGTKTITQNGTYNATDDNLDGYSEVTVSVSGGVTPTGTKQISITENGTTTEDVTNYASAEITVNVSGGSSVTAQDIYDGTFPSGDVVVSNKSVTGISLYGNTVMTSFASDSITQFKASSAFYGCTALKTVRLTGAISQNQSNMWQNCPNLESIEMPNYNTSLGQYALADNPKLTFADIGNCSQVVANAFKNASILNTIVIRRTSVCSLQNVSAFAGTPFASGGSGGTICVPSSLISSYQTASNWSTLHGYGTITWKAIEGSEYE